MIEILIENVDERFIPMSNTNHVWRYKNIYSIKIRSSYRIKNMLLKWWYYFPPNRLKVLWNLFIELRKTFENRYINNFNRRHNWNYLQVFVSFSLQKSICELFFDVPNILVKVWWMCLAGRFLYRDPGFCDARDLLYRAPYLLPTLLFIVSAT